MRQLSHVAQTMPMATASPCSKERWVLSNAKASSPWPMEWPKLSSLRGPCSQGVFLHHLGLDVGRSLIDGASASRLDAKVPAAPGSNARRHAPGRA